MIIVIVLLLLVICFLVVFSVAAIAIAILPILSFLVSLSCCHLCCCYLCCSIITAIVVAIVAILILLSFCHHSCHVWLSSPLYYFYNMSMTIPNETYTAVDSGAELQAVKPTISSKHCPFEGTNLQLADHCKHFLSTVFMAPILAFTTTYSASHHWPFQELHSLWLASRKKCFYQKIPEFCKLLLLSCCFLHHFCCSLVVVVVVPKYVHSNTSTFCKMYS